MNYEEQYKEEVKLFNSIYNRFNNIQENDVVGAYRLMLDSFQAYNRWSKIKCDIKKDIESFEPDSVVNKMRFKDKLQEVNYLIEVIETGAEYNFHKRMERCKSRKEKSDDAGMDALSAAVVLKENKKEDKNDR